MALFSPGTGHWLWTKFLLALGSGRVARAPIAALGWLRWALQPTARHQVERRYAALAALARQAGQEGRLTQLSPAALARGHYHHRALVGVVPLLCTEASSRYLAGIMSAPDYPTALDAAKQGRGLLITATHYGSMGLTPTLLRRGGQRVVILRDQQFRKLENTRHGRQFFSGEPIFLDRQDPASPQKALLKCARAFREGAVIAYTMDASHGAHSHTGSLFGQPVIIRTALLDLAIRQGTPVVFGFGYVRQGIVVSQISPPQIISNEDQRQQWLEGFFRQWEWCILNYPEGVSWSKSDLEMIGEMCENSLSTF